MGAQTMPSATELWEELQERHQKARDRNKGNRTPITVLASARTLNQMVNGNPGNYLSFSKTVFCTSMGDVHVQPHAGITDGEIVVL